MREPKGLRLVGLARALSKLGYCSRSEARRLIEAGRVRLNGTIQHNPEAPTRFGAARIEVDNRLVGVQGRTYLMLNKPGGLVTTVSDEKGRETVYACLPAALRWIAPVGRLDKASEGLLLMTNDSEWAARITAPETHLEKIYHVQVRGIVDRDLPERLVEGFPVQDGQMLRVKSARILRQGERNTWIAVVLDEGKNRHIRRMLAQRGIEVLRLVRISIGPVSLGELPKGASRPLTQRELQLLDIAMFP